jgi:hypothetical protein
LKSLRDIIEGELMNWTKLATLAVGTFATMSAGATEITGDWKVEGSIGQVAIRITCSLSESGQKLTGVCRGKDISDLPLKGETDGSTVSWGYSVNYQGQQLNVSYQGTLGSPTEMQGTIAVMDNPSGSFTAKRQAPA